MARSCPPASLCSNSWTELGQGIWTKLDHSELVCPASLGLFPHLHKGEVLPVFTAPRPQRVRGWGLGSKQVLALESLGSRKGLCVCLLFELRTFALSLHSPICSELIECLLCAWPSARCGSYSVVWRDTHDLCPPGGRAQWHSGRSSQLSLGPRWGETGVPPGDIILTSSPGWSQKAQSGAPRSHGEVFLDKELSLSPLGPQVPRSDLCPSPRHHTGLLLASYPAHEMGRVRDFGGFYSSWKVQAGWLRPLALLSLQWEPLWILALVLTLRQLRPRTGKPKKPDSVPFLHMALRGSWCGVCTSAPRQSKAGPWEEMGRWEDSAPQLPLRLLSEQG